MTQTSGLVAFVDRLAGVVMAGGGVDGVVGGCVSLSGRGCDRMRRLLVHLQLFLSLKC